jgi:hypothetical protein
MKKKKKKNKKKKTNTDWTVPNINLTLMRDNVKG